MRLNQAARRSPRDLSARGMGFVASVAMLGAILTGVGTGPEPSHAEAKAPEVQSAGILRDLIDIIKEWLDIDERETDPDPKLPDPNDGY